MVYGYYRSKNTEKAASPARRRSVFLLLSLLTLASSSLFALTNLRTYNNYEAINTAGHSQAPAPASVEPALSYVGEPLPPYGAGQKPIGQQQDFSN